MRTRETVRKATSSPTKRLVDSFPNMQVNADDNIMSRIVTGSPKPQVTPVTRTLSTGPMTPTGDTQPSTCQRMPKPQVRTNDTPNPQLSAGPDGQHPPYVVGGAWTGCVTRPLEPRGRGVQIAGGEPDEPPGSIATATAFQNRFCTIVRKVEEVRAAMDAKVAALSPTSRDRLADEWAAWFAAYGVDLDSDVAREAALAAAAGMVKQIGELIEAAPRSVRSPLVAGILDAAPLAVAGLVAFAWRSDGVADPAGAGGDR